MPCVKILEYTRFCACDGFYFLWCTIAVYCSRTTARIAHEKCWLSLGEQKILEGVKFRGGTLSSPCDEWPQETRNKANAIECGDCCFGRSVKSSRTVRNTGTRRVNVEERTGSRSVIADLASNMMWEIFQLASNVFIL